MNCIWSENPGVYCDWFRSVGHIGAFLMAAARLLSRCLSFSLPVSWIKLAKVCRCRLIFSKWNLGNSKFSLFFFFLLSCKNNLLWWATSLQPSLVSATFWIRLVIPSEGSLGLEPGSIVKDWYKFISDVCRKYCYAAEVVMSFNAVCGGTQDSYLQNVQYLRLSYVSKRLEFRKT